MGLCNEGAIEMAAALIGEAAAAYNNAQARIGVGNGNAAFSVSQEDLQGASKQRNAMMSTFPQRTNGVITFKASFAAGEANFPWEEWAVFNTASANVGMLSRKVESNGTKSSPQVWEFTATITISST